MISGMVAGYTHGAAKAAWDNHLDWLKEGHSAEEMIERHRVVRKEVRQLRATRNLCGVTWAFGLTYELIRALVWWVP